MERKNVDAYEMTLWVGFAVQYDEPILLRNCGMATLTVTIIRQL
jgi:hypothetical protein